MIYLALSISGLQAMNALWQIEFISALLFSESFVVIYNKAAGLYMKIYIKGSRQIIHEIIF